MDKLYLGLVQKVYDLTCPGFPLRQPASPTRFTARFASLLRQRGERGGRGGLTRGIMN